MNIAINEAGIRVLSINMVGVAALASVLLLLGYAIRDRVKFLEKMCIPAPVIGGFLCSILVWILRATDLMQVSFDTTFQTPFMLAFFTCVGFSGSFKMLKTGGRLLIVFLIACWGLAMAQGAIGVGMAYLFGIHPVLGVMAGPVSMVGGHGNAAAWGPVAEGVGVHGATAVAVAAATLGLVLGNLTGGPVGDFIIRKNKVEIKTDEIKIEVKEDASEPTGMFSLKSFMSHFSIILVFMFGGLWIADLIDLLDITNFSLPHYVGAMFLAIVFRNINDKKELLKLDPRIINLIMEVGLSIFLTMAIMNLRMWELIDLAVPLLAIVAVQWIFLILVAIFILFRAMGKNYDSAVMTGGYAGWGTGIAATAVVCMGAICEKYNLRSPKAFMIVPLGGAVFVDIVAIPTIIFLITTFA
ncbi:MAG: sodium/glutamate symporter [Defluviitaleaceae bacterium]|nr:sodium/glutamate symporter [Defluviitaleaceae bacterium]